MRAKRNAFRIFQDQTRRRPVGSGAGDSPASVSSGDSPEESGDEAACAAGVFSTLEVHGALGRFLRSHCSGLPPDAFRKFPSWIPWGLRLPFQGCCGERTSGESPEETEAGESPAPLPTGHLLFGPEYPKGIRSSSDFHQWR